MRAMILAAGRGTRMGVLTENTPKPLLKVKNYFLIEYALYSLIKIGIQDIIINISYQAEQIKQALGNGARYGVNIHYSMEEEALETGGGIYQALPLLGSEPFIVLSCDVITDYPLEKLPKHPAGLAHLVLVNNPNYNQQGDFCLSEQRIHCKGDNTFTFSNVGIYRPELFAGCKPGKFRLGSLLRDAIEKEAITGERYEGIWYNVGTVEELNKINQLP